MLAVRKALAEKNWYAALAVALTLPDICGRLESPNVASLKRYVRWCDSYLTPRYTKEMPGGMHIFLGGQDCYALRCAFLHEGRDEIVDQRARKALESFMFITPPHWGSMHCNQVNSKLQLQVDLFCEDICVGVEQWNTDNSNNREVSNRSGEMMRIMDSTNGISF